MLIVDPQTNMSDLNNLKKILLLILFLSEEVKTLVFHLLVVLRGLKSQLGEDADQILGSVSSSV